MEIPIADNIALAVTWGIGAMDCWTRVIVRVPYRGSCQLLQALLQSKQRKPSMSIYLSSLAPYKVRH